MERLYCPECGNYLEGGDGSMVDCHCGWRQERSIESDEEEIEQLHQRVAELERGLDSAYQLADHYRAERDALKQQRDVFLAALVDIQQVACSGSPELGIASDAIASVKEKT